MRTHSTLAKSAVVAIVVATTFTLSGCFANPIDQITDKIGSGIAEGGAEKLVEGMTGGGVDIETGKLPKDFPAEVPLIDGAVQSALAMTIEGEKTWTVSIKVDDVVAATNQGREKLLAAGFEETMWNESESMLMGMFSGSVYGVILSGASAGDDVQAVSYQVIPATE